MKTRVALLLLVLDILPLYAAPKFNSKNTVVVNYPVVQNIPPEDLWIPDFIQGQLTTYLQKYSVMTVIDRASVSNLLSEQMIAEANEFATNKKQEDLLNYATIINADYILVVELSQINDKYNLSCVMQDKKNNKTVPGVSYSTDNITNENLINGSAMQAVSYELLIRMGEKKSKISELLENSEKMNSDVAADYYIAKGLYVQSMQDSVDYDFAMYDEWKKIWNDFVVYREEIWLQVFYCMDFLNFRVTNFDTETANIKIPFSIGVNNEVIKLYNQLEVIYSNTKKHRNWNIKIPSISGAEIVFQLLNNQKLIAEKSFKISPNDEGKVKMAVFESIETAKLDDIHIEVKTSCPQAMIKCVPGIKIEKKEGN